MVVIKSPFSKRMHSVRHYDMDDYILNNATTKERKSQNVFRNAALVNDKGWNNQVWNTRVDEYRDWTLSRKYIEESARREKKRRKPRKWFGY